jgi:hypothetical protein
MHCQLGEDALGVVPGRVGADSQLMGDGSVGLAARQQLRNVQLAAGESKSNTKIVRPVQGHRSGSPSGLGPKLSPELPHLVNGAPQLIDQISAILPQRREGRE